MRRSSLIVASVVAFTVLILLLVWTRALLRHSSSSSSSSSSYDETVVGVVGVVSTATSPSTVATTTLLKDGDLIELFPLRHNVLVVDQRSQWRAIVTLVTQREYLIGAFGLGASLRAVRTTFPLVACLPADLASFHSVRRNLTIAGFDYVRVIARLGNPARDIGRLHQAHKVDVFTKLRMFQMLEFARIVYLDADTVVRRNVDSLLDLPYLFAVAPEVTPMWRCIGQPYFIFHDEEQNEDWCHGHTRELYHGRVIKLSNTGVMLLTPSNETFDALWSLTLDELTHNDTCIGMAGCNDQRVINVFYDEHPYKQLSVLYNVFCDQYIQGNFSVFRHHKPYVFHYRGQASFKPWILRPGSPRESWNDQCGEFVKAYMLYERAFAEAQRSA